MRFNLNVVDLHFCFLSLNLNIEILRNGAKLYLTINISCCLPPLWSTHLLFCGAGYLAVAHGWLQVLSSHSVGYTLLYRGTPVFIEFSFCSFLFFHFFCSALAIHAFLLITPLQADSLALLEIFVLGTNLQQYQKKKIVSCNDHRDI